MRFGLDALQIQIARSVFDEAAFNGLAHIAHQLSIGFAPSGAAGNRWDFRPEPAFFRFMDDHFEFHAHTPRSHR